VNVGAAWVTADHYLWQQLKTWLAAQGSSGSWLVDLFVNDYEPTPGDTFSSYETPNWGQWPTYRAIPIPFSAWGPVQVADSVAQSVQRTALQWLRPAGVLSIEVYGYVVSDGFGSLVYAESFSAPVTVVSPGIISIIARYNLGNYPIPSLLNKKRGRKRAAELAADDASAEDD
jgi:hypothetical protein